MGIRPERWIKALRPQHTAVLSTAEESSVAKDEWSKSQSTRLQRASSQRARRGDFSLKSAPHDALERSGGEGGGRIPYQAHVKHVLTKSVTCVRSDRRPALPSGTSMLASRTRTHPRRTLRAVGV